LTRAVLVAALDGLLGGADPATAVKSFSVDFANDGPTRRERRRRRALLGTATVSFQVVASLAEVGAASAGTFEATLASSLEAAVEDGSLSAAAQTACSCSVAAATVALAALQDYPTLRPTQVPSPPPSPVPSLQPTPVPSLRPSPLPTVSPTELDTVGVDVTLNFEARAPPTELDKLTLKAVR
jgi:hypothetical protein